MFLDAWVDGWMGVKAVLRIAYSIQKFGSAPIKNVPGWMGGWMDAGGWMGWGESRFKECLLQFKSIAKQYFVCAYIEMKPSRRSTFKKIKIIFTQLMVNGSNNLVL